MIDDYTFVKSKELMKTIIGNYEDKEQKYHGYTAKKDAIELICTCYSKGWDDLADNTARVFNLDQFTAELKKVALDKPNKTEYQILLEDIIKSKKY